MKLLLDENIPKRLKLDFKDHEVFTVSDKGWNGIKNGELIKLLINDGFDALLNFDKNLQYQQNLSKYNITIFVLIANNNTYLQLSPLPENIRNYLENTNLPKNAIIIRSGL